MAAPALHPYADLGDDELIALARSGKRGAFDLLVRRHQGWALRVATHYLGQPAAAKDAAQNAFVELYRGLQSYRCCGRFPAYLQKVLINQCRMAHRHSRKHMNILRALEPIDGTDDGLLRRAHNRDIERAVSRLSEKQRVVVVLRFAGGLTYHEIADTLELPIGTVQSRLFAGLRLLRRELA